MPRKPLHVVIAIVAFVFSVIAGERGYAANVFETEQVRATLISEVTGAKPGDKVWVALRFDIAPGWHTYWQNPGDSGEPTRIDWRLPEGVGASDIQWPYPESIPYGPLVNFGYKGRVLHLVQIAVPDTWPNGKAIDLVADATWLVCADICIPQSATLDIQLATDIAPGSNPDTASDFAAARRLLPVESPWPASFTTRGDSLRIDIETGTTDAGVVDAYFFPFNWGNIEPSADQKFLRDGAQFSLITRKGERLSDTNLDGILVVTEKTGDGELTWAIELSAAPAGTIEERAQESVGAGFSIADTQVETPTLPLIIVFAILGGLVLNLMPCVFPVLSMKAMSLIRHGSGSVHERRVGGLAYTAGVLVFMGLVAGLLILLRASGEQIGWGFQLQSPAFVGVMAIILFVLGLNLSGLFEVGGAVPGWGGGVASRSGAAGSFMTGGLAALVATPCTAPFMGTAVGFALTQSWPIALSVMLALGFGLALPYLILTQVPGLARLLPRPGAWMERVRQFLAFPMYASVAWLIWVLSLQTGSDGVLAILAALVLVAFGIWLHRVSRDLTGATRLSGNVGALVAGAAALALAVSLQVSEHSLAAPNDAVAATEVAENELLAEPFSIQRLEELRRHDKPVFANITAAWCITCKFNERVALKSDRLSNHFKERGITYLKGDWTRRDAEITRFLASFGRSGVPLYVVYGDRGQTPVVLPQILTEAIVMEALADIGDRVPQQATAKTAKKMD